MDETPQISARKRPERRNKSASKATVRATAARGKEKEKNGNGHGEREIAQHRARRATESDAELDRLLDALAAVDRGEFSVRLPMKGDGGLHDRIALTFNSVVARNEALAAEMVRVERMVGREGRIGERATLGPGAAGGWASSVGAVNALIADLVQMTTEVARVIGAVAEGDLSQQMALRIDGAPVQGEFMRIGTTVNSMVAQLSAFSAEVTRVAKEVGTEGKLGGQADVKGVSGVWKDLTDNVNQMASNLTTQVRGIVKVVNAVANGDLTQELQVNAKGEIAALADTLNSMTKTLGIFAQQVTSVARTVGVEGKLGAQAEVPNVAGTWKVLTDSVNLLANNLTAQVRNIAEVTTAVAKGDLSRKISVDAKGEVNELKNTINIMVDQLRSFAGEVARVAKEVGTEGKLGGQAEVTGLSGTWKDLTDNVNVLARNLTDQVRNIAKVTTAVANGDLSQKITVDVQGEILELKNTINVMVDQLRSFASEVTRVAKEVGTEGKLGGQARVQGVSGTWKDLTDNVNVLADNLTEQVRNIAKVTTAVANGDLSQKIAVEARGEILELKNTINTMVEQLRSFASEVTRVAKEVGTEGKLGGQAEVRGVSGTWKGLTDNVNFMASNLTTQVRGIVKVVTAVANGDLTMKLIGVEAKGEIAALADTINDMCDTLSTFAEQVSTVAREVGIEGKLGGQAKVPGAMGTWRQLTDNVNQLAGNLTSQVRAISDVATAVTKGDLTRFIDVHAEGEVASLKDNINQMIVNLKETTQKNAEQDWLKTNLARFSSMMQGQKSLKTVGDLIMSQLTPLVSAQHGAFFMAEHDDDGPALALMSSYAYSERKRPTNRFRLREGLVGQCALEKKPILVTKVPPDYVQITSGLGEAPPLNVIVFPVLFEGDVKAVVELASFSPFSPIHLVFLDQVTESIGVVLNMITANMRTEELLLQSQTLTHELQSQSTELTEQKDELKRTNVALEKQALELEEKARQLAGQNAKVEEKNREVEQARVSLEEKAEQLALISKYKSEFLANMSHELRTPLNSLLILARLLSENAERNLSSKQVEYAKTIHASGVDLLALINEILDLSKVEAGQMRVDPRVVPFEEVCDFVERNFRPVAEQKGLEFGVHVAPDLAEMTTDPQRLQQVLKNLLSNAFKFTEVGKVELKIHRVASEILFDNRMLTPGNVVAFDVRDTGIGIARNKQRIIFEAFQQADGNTNRKYGGTGLGLSISREITRLLGGEIHVASRPGEGSTFTLYLPLDYEAPAESDEADTDPARHVVAARSTEPPEGIRASEPVSPPSDDASRHVRGRRVLIIDDDVRNIFAMSSVLESRGLEVVFAENGKSGIEVLERTPDIDLILMDVMMPEMDGYETIRAIRAQPQYKKLPIVAVTAKALKEDREKCLAAGATDYLPKPVDAERLLGLIAMWTRGDASP